MNNFYNKNKKIIICFLVILIAISALYMLYTTKENFDTTYFTNPTNSNETVKNIGNLYSNYEENKKKDDNLSDNNKENFSTTYFTDPSECERRTFKNIENILGISEKTLYSLICCLFCVLIISLSVYMYNRGKKSMSTSISGGEYTYIPEITDSQ